MFLIGLDAFHCTNKASVLCASDSTNEIEGYWGKSKNGWSLLKHSHLTQNSIYLNRLELLRVFAQSAS